MLGNVSGFIVEHLLLERELGFWDENVHGVYFTVTVILVMDLFPWILSVGCCLSYIGLLSTVLILCTGLSPLLQSAVRVHCCHH
jgi:hypothetical protein